MEILASMKYLRDEKALKAFGENLKKLREKKKFSQEQLAYLADIEHSQVIRIEKARINTGISTVFALAKALEVPPKKLFDF